MSKSAPFKNFQNDKKIFRGAQLSAYLLKIFINNHFQINIAIKQIA